MNNKKITIEVNGEKFEVLEDTKGVCTKCGQPTYCESYEVYGDDPYAMEICSGCGSWSNSVMSSDDMTEETIFEPSEEEYDENEFEDMLQALYLQMYYDTYGFIFDDESDRIDGKLLKEAFNKTCYNFDVEYKTFDKEVVADESYLSILNYSMVALVPVSDTMTRLVAHTITDYQHTCPGV